MIKEFADIYSNFNLAYEEILAEIYFVLDIEFSLHKKDIIMGKKLASKDFNSAIKIFEERVKTHKPIQHILNKALFMDDIFYVDENVLIPRDDTQVLVEKAKEIITQKNLSEILDLCTGSGIIAIELKKHTQKNIFASDISLKALEISKKNAKQLNIDINFIHSDLFTHINQKFDMIVSNPPYIPYSEKNNLQIEVQKFEPEIALFAENNGYYFYETIIKNSHKYLNQNGILLFEIGINQAETIKQLFRDNNYTNIFVEKDVTGIDRVIGGYIK